MTFRKTFFRYFLFLIIFIFIAGISHFLFGFEDVNIFNLDNNKLKYLKIAIERGKRDKTDYKQIYDEDYTWDYTFEEAGHLFNEIYYSGKRIRKHIYYDDKKNSFMMPIDDSCNMEVSWDFIYSITRHIEEALNKGWADYIFLPDMGHGHFYLPKDSAIFECLASDNSDRQIFYEILNSKETKILYHTAEMFCYFGGMGGFQKLSFYEQYRNLTRNIVGSFVPAKDMLQFITSDIGIPVINFNSNYTKVGQDIDFSASIDGNFPFSYKGKLYYFDISRFSPDGMPFELWEQLETKLTELKKPEEKNLWS